MNVYYVGGMPISDELYHHGIKGQKWGVRRYQNPDGTLTAEGRARYGEAVLGSYGLGKQGLVRRISTGDWALGSKRLGEKRENKLKNKLDSGRLSDAQRTEIQKKYETQKDRNIKRDIYNSHASTGKLFAQKYLFGLAADSYRISRAEGHDRFHSYAEAVVDSMLSGMTGYVVSPNQINDLRKR